MKRYIKKSLTLIKSLLRVNSFISDSTIPTFSVDHDYVVKLGFSGQYGQDYFVSKFITFLPVREKYTFVDLGAHDGKQFSNSLFLDEISNWQGICIEANPKVFKNLVHNRPATRNINIAISQKNELVKFQVNTGYSEMLSGVVKNYDLRHRFRIKRDIEEHEDSSEIMEVVAMRLDSLFENLRVSHVDILFIDIEGSELSALLSIDFNKTEVNMILVERNYSSRKVLKLLQKTGFERIAALGSDDLYINSKLIRFSRSRL